MHLKFIQICSFVQKLKKIKFWKIEEENNFWKKPKILDLVNCGFCWISKKLIIFDLKFLKIKIFWPKTVFDLHTKFQVWPICHIKSGSVGTFLHGHLEVLELFVIFLIFCVFWIFFIFKIVCDFVIFWE